MKKRVGRVALFVLVPVLFLGLALPVLGTLIAPSVPHWVGEHKTLCIALGVAWCIVTATALWLQRDEPTPTPAPDARTGSAKSVTITGATLQQSPLIDGNNNRVTFGNDNRTVVRKGKPHEKAQGCSRDARRGGMRRTASKLRTPSLRIARSSPATTTGSTTSLSTSA